MEWISAKDKLPESETKVLICVERDGNRIITLGFYEDGNVKQNESRWSREDLCSFCGLLINHDYRYDPDSIPKGWWEEKRYYIDDDYNRKICGVVTHWMPLQEPPEV